LFWVAKEGRGGQWEHTVFVMFVDCESCWSAF